MPCRASRAAHAYPATPFPTIATSAFTASDRGAVEDLQRLQVGVEVERIVAALTADPGDPDRPTRAARSSEPVYTIPESP